MNPTINAIDILEKLEQFRQTHQNDKQHPSDWCMRVMEAIVAKEAGFTNRNDWTDILAERAVS